MVALPKTPLTNSMTAFLDWPADPNGQAWQPINGEPVAMAPASETHGSTQNEIGRLLGSHLLRRKLPCRMIDAPGVSPQIHAESNVRMPDGDWPATPEQVTGCLRLTSIDGWFEVPDLYSTTDMAPGPGRL